MSFTAILSAIDDGRQCPPSGYYTNMDSTICSTTHSDYISSTDPSSQNGLVPFAGPFDLYSSYSGLQPSINFNHGYGDTNRQTTPMFLPSSMNHQRGQYLPPVLDTGYPTTTHAPAYSSEKGSSSHFRDEDTRHHGTIPANDQNTLSRTEGLLAPERFDGGNIPVRMTEGIGNKRRTASLRAIDSDDYAESTPNRLWDHTLQYSNREGLGSFWFSQLKRLLEPRDDSYGLRCPVCKQLFKRRDYIKPHVKRKHLEHYDRVYCTPSSTPEQPIATSVNCTSAHNELSIPGVIGHAKWPYSTAPWNHRLDTDTPYSIRSEFPFPGACVATQKRSHDGASPDGGSAIERFEIERSKRLKTSHDKWERSLACPFYKHYPFSHRKCLALVLRRPKDVKQHIYRCHTKPEFYCARCYEIFRTAAERDTHWREESCESVDGHLLFQSQWINDYQREKLNEKSPRDLDVESQWFQIYDIIFSDSARPRSPYVGNCLEEMVPLLRQMWETQRRKITNRAVRKSRHHQLGFAMDLFFKSLEGETLDHETDDDSTYAEPAQYQIEDSSQQWTESLLFQ